MLLYSVVVKLYKIMSVVNVIKRRSKSNSNIYVFTSNKNNEV